MNSREITNMRDTTRANVATLLQAAIDALTRAETALAEANRTIEGLRGELTEAQRVPEPTASVIPEAEVSENYMRQPEIPGTPPTVRFLSKSSVMGGLANVRASMNDLGINAKRLRLEGSSYTPNDDVLLINWGGGFDVPSNLSNFGGRHLNKLDAVKIAANKLKTFEKLKADSYLCTFTPECTTSAESARDHAWSKTYARETLYGHSGEGITVVNRGDRLPNVPLYVEGLNIRNEYRVHTVNGFTKIQKKARLGDENCDMLVRNNAGGWTFINEFTLGARGKGQLHDLSVKVLECLGLDFGAVDVIRTEEGQWKVLEVNTAPGVTAESNIEWYTKALLN